MRVDAKTDAGLVRKQNEDCYCVGELPEGVVWAVICDGMGGAAAGDVASATAVKAIADTIVSAYQPQMRSMSIQRLLETAIRDANQQIFALSEANESLAGMGTTAVAAIVSGDAAYVCHAGDSRAYLYSNGALRQITKDHSIVQVMVDNGQITEEEAKVHPRKNLITRALGIEQELEADFYETKFCHGDALLVCTDGLTNTVDKNEILQILKTTDFSQYVQALVAAAINNGGPDNITVVVIENQ